MIIFEQVVSSLSAPEFVLQLLLAAPLEELWQPVTTHQFPFFFDWLLERRYSERRHLTGVLVRGFCWCYGYLTPGFRFGLARFRLRALDFRLTATGYFQRFKDSQRRRLLALRTILRWGFSGIRSPLRSLWMLYILVRSLSMRRLSWILGWTFFDVQKWLVQIVHVQPRDQMVNFHGRCRCADGIYAAFAIFTNDMGCYVLRCTSIAICFARI